MTSTTAHCRGAQTRFATSLLAVALLLAEGCGSRDAGNSGAAARGTPNGAPVLKADPNPVPKAEKLGKTTITWNTGDGSWGQVYVSVNGGEERLFKQEKSGAEEA